MSAKNERRGRNDPGRVLIVDDEADIRELLDLTMVRMGLRADCAGSVAEARRLLAENTYQLCLTDMRLPDGEGLELVHFINDSVSDLPVAVITAYGSTENAVSALKAGAFDYLAKPVSLDQLRSLVKSALDVPGSETVAAAPAIQTLLGESSAMQEVRALIARVARSQAPVYIHGESGSGKELAARLIHQLGARSQQPFVPVNCGAIPENLMESEFFGYRRGAFTGADSDRDGFFQAANGGTLFLDEVAELPLTMQVKLLRAIQEKRVRKVGSASEDAVDVRIVCATHQRLKALVDEGRFRQDLFFRLNVIELRMPGLRECRDDIPLLARNILGRLATAAGVSVPSLTPAALRALAAYAFPGNVRELENILERSLALLTTDAIDVSDLNLAPPQSAELPLSGDQLPLQDYLDRVEKQAILNALQQTRFNRTAAAKVLGVTFRSLRYRMERLGLNE
jgi:two-component system response regulator PilR (NtrC family)